MTALDETTARYIASLFPLENVTEATGMLAEAWEGIEYIRGDLQRCRCAAVRSSGGRLDLLREAIELGATDFRDLLMRSEFANDVTAHLAWRPRRLDAATLDYWRSGGTIDGVAFKLGEPVKLRTIMDWVEFRSAVAEGQISINDFPTEPTEGRIVELKSLEPQPRYEIDTPTHGRIDRYQSAVACAG